MTTPTRIYLVTQGNETYLVRAANQHRAINHVAKSSIKAHVATQLELVELVSNGARVLDATASGDEA